MRLLDDEELLRLGRAPVDQVRDALAAGDLNGAAEIAARAERAWQRTVSGYHLWIAHTYAFLAEQFGTGATASAIGALTRALGDTDPWPEDGPSGAEPDDDPILVAILDAESRLRREHDVWLDAVCLTLSHVYQEHGIDTLEAALRRTGERTLVAWMPRDLERPPEERIRVWAGMMHGNFATITVEEDDDTFTIVQDPCGSCGRQIRARGYPGPLDLAVVTQRHPITYDRGGIPVYRTHVAVMHSLMPREQIGVPWPVIQCPPGCEAGPCRITLYKDPLDQAALSHTERA
jgi:hypothetical protein